MKWNDFPKWVKGLIVSSIFCTLMNIFMVLSFASEIGSIPIPNKDLGYVFAIFIISFIISPIIFFPFLIISIFKHRKGETQFNKDNFKTALKIIVLDIIILVIMGFCFEFIYNRYYGRL